jgi:hypothetical protein
MGNILPFAKACRIAPITLIQDPNIIDQRLPKFWFTHGTKGSAKIAPREYEAPRKPFKFASTAYLGTPLTTCPVAFPKSTTQISISLAIFNYTKNMSRIVHFCQEGTIWTTLII